MSVIVLIGLPFAAGGYLKISSSKYLEQLLTTHIGRVILPATGIWRFKTMQIFSGGKQKEIRPAVLLILLFLLFSACGPSQVSLKPEIQLVRPAVDDCMARMQREHLSANFYR